MPAQGSCFLHWTPIQSAIMPSMDSNKGHPSLEGHFLCKTIKQHHWNVRAPHTHARTHIGSKVVIEIDISAVVHRAVAA